nr:MAK10-like protein [Tanacetum cinerariifolium]
MGDENPIGTLEDYSRPSHEGYRNTIKLLEGNNMVPLRSDTIRLVQNGCSFHGLRFEDPNQHLKDFLKLVDSLELDGQGSLDYKNPDIKQLLGVMECKVDTLMKEVISLMGRSESIFGMTSNTRYQLPSGPSRQEEFKDLVMNFILDQEERIKQLKNYMQDITDEFMDFSSEVILRINERIKENKSKSQKIEKITREVPSFNGSKPQPLLNNPSSDINLGEERGLKPPIKPHSPG